MSSQVTLTRQQLYDLVWADSLTSIAKKYKISDNGLRKICKRMNIPLPKYGHWQKIKYGKPVKLFPLPGNFTGNDEISFDERSFEGNDKVSPVASLRRLAREIENTKDLPLKVPDRLTNPDKLIVKTKDNLFHKKSYGMDRGLTNKGNDLIDFNVSPDNVARALILMDAIIKLVKARGHQIDVVHYSTHIILNLH